MQFFNSLSKIPFGRSIVQQRQYLSHQKPLVKETMEDWQYVKEINKSLMENKYTEAMNHLISVNGYLLRVT